MADWTVRGAIEVFLKGTGLKDAKTQLSDVEKGAGKVKGELSGAEKAARKLRNTFFVTFGGKVLVGFVKNAVKEFAAWEAQLRTTAKEAERLGLPVAATVKRVDALTQALEAQTGVLRQTTVPLFNKLIGVTEDAAAAELLLTAATGAQVQGFNSAANAGKLFGSLLAGEVIEPAKSLGIAFRKSNGEMKTSAEVLDEAIDKFLNFNDSAKSTQSNLQQMNADWNDFKLAVGEGFSKLVNMVGGLRNVTKAAKTVGLAITGGMAVAVQAVVELGKTLADVFNLKRLFTEGPGAYANAIADTFKRANENIRFSEEALAEQFVEIWDKAETDVTQTVEQQTAAREKIRTIASLKEIERQKKEAERLAAEAKKLADKRVEFEQQMQDQLLAEKINAAEEGSTERLALEEEALDRAKKSALATAHELKADETAIEEAFQIAIQALRDSYANANDDKARERASKLTDFMIAQAQQRIEDEFDMLDDADIRKGEKAAEFLEFLAEQEMEYADEIGADVQAVRDKWNRRITASDAKWAKIRKQIAKEEALVKTEIAAAIAAGSIQALETAFGEHKAFGIASAIIDTWVGVNRALADPGGPAGVALAAVVAAIGLANVATIMKTDKGASSGASAGAAPSGFDDPVNDRLARLRGQRWAADLVRNVDTGMASGLAARASQSVGGPPSPGSPLNIDDDDDDPAPNVTIGTFFGGRNGMRQLTRILRREARLDRRAIR